MRNILFASVACLAAIGSSANAYDGYVSGARVTLIDSSYVPDGLYFQIDKAVGSCAAGTTLAWSIRGADAPSRIASAQAALSVLLTAYSTGRTLQLYVNSSNCSVELMHFKEG